MPFPYTGKPSAAQPPSPAPYLGGLPVVNIPTLGDRLADLWAQPVTALADWVAFFAAQPTAQAYGVLLRAIVLTTGTSIASSPGCRRARARLIGGGGGGGGCSNLARGAGGGSSGGYAELLTAAIPSVWTYTIGAAGAAGTSAPTDGGNGGDTMLIGLSDVVTAYGGFGGGAGVNNTNQLIGQPGFAAFLSSGGTINGSGEAGGGALALICSGFGGSSQLGGAGGRAAGIGYVVQAGIAGTGLGAGGSGGFGAGAANVAGGAGTTGAILLEEWS